MICYCITASHVDDSESPTGFRDFWVGSKRAAAAKRAELRRDGWEVLETWEREVPTDKKSLVQWLDINCQY